MVPPLGNTIRVQRLQLGLTQEQLVEGFATKSTLSQIESGKSLPSVDLLLQIADRLHIDIEALLSDSPFYRKPVELAKIAGNLYLKGNYASALRFFQHWLETVPESQRDALNLLKIGVCHGKIGDVPQAVSYIEGVQQMAAVGGDCITRYFAVEKMGELYYDQGNYQLALHYWLRALERRPAADTFNSELIWRLYNRIGAACCQLGEHETAITYYYDGMQYIQEDCYISQRAVTLMNVAVSLKHLGQFERAGEMYSELRQADRELEPLIDLLIRLNYGVYLGATGRFEQGITLLQQVRHDFVVLGEARCVTQVDNELADMYRRCSDCNKARDILTELIARLPSDDVEYALAIRTMGLLYNDSGEQEAAIGYLQEALQLFEAQGRIGHMKQMQAIISENFSHKEQS